MKAAQRLERDMEAAVVFLGSTAHRDAHGNEQPHRRHRHPLKPRHRWRVGRGDHHS
jgi:hypothetical protein